MANRSQIATGSQNTAIRKKLADLDQKEVDAAIARLPGIVGKPHEPRGASVRRLKPGFFELRAGLRLRVVFTLSKDVAVLWIVGDHDHVHAWLSLK